MSRRYLRPSEIRFSQDTIKSEFTNGDHVNTVANEVCTGHRDEDDFTIMEVFEKDGEYYTLNNRMLYVFRVAEYRGDFNKELPVKLKRKTVDALRKLTTDNGGVEVTVRNDAKTLEHYDPNRWDL